MTAIFYPDVEARSPGGGFRLEAKSPDNGTIEYRKRKRTAPPTFGFQYRQHQREFRYRLLEVVGDRELVVWERWQPHGEDSPHELHVSDGGWSVIRTHGFQPEVIAVDPVGDEAVRVRVVGDWVERDADALGQVWVAEEMASTTAGYYWADHSWPYFFTHADSELFCWHAAWGDQLILDLTRRRPVPEASEVAGLVAALDAAETRSVKELFASLAERWGEVESVLRHLKNGRREAAPADLLAALKGVTVAAQIAGDLGLASIAPHLREWEAIDYPSYSTGTTALPSGGWWLESQYFRPAVQHALKRLGQEPAGYPTYHFIRSFDEPKQRLPMPSLLPDRRERAATLDTAMSATEVLGLVGSPEFVRRRSERDGEFCRWSEAWDYDFRIGTRWTTLRLIWEEVARHGRLASITEVPADWMHSGEREQEFLRQL